MTKSVHLQVKTTLPDFSVDIDVSSMHGRLALFGPSGAGKSTILKALAGIAPSAVTHLKLGDHVVVDTGAGIAPRTHERRIGFVFQDDRLFPHLTVADNIAYGATQVGGSFETAIQIADVEALLPRGIGGLSGGERRRVALARALAMDPALLLLDEPYNGLDRKGATALRNRLANQLQACGIPFVLVTHTLDDVLAHDCDVVLIERGKVSGQGPAEQAFASAEGLRVLASGDAAERAGPVSIFRINRTSRDQVNGLLTCHLANEAVLLLPNAENALPSAFIKVAASDVSIATSQPTQSSILNVLPATIRGLKPEGEMTVADLDLGGALVLKARITSYSAGHLGLTTGQRIFAQIKSAALAS